MFCTLQREHLFHPKEMSKNVLEPKLPRPVSKRFRIRKPSSVKSKLAASLLNKDSSPSSNTGAIDGFLEQVNNPEYWSTFTDPKTGQKIALTREEISVIQKLMQKKFAADAYDPYAPSVDFFTHKVHPEPIVSRKRSIKSRLHNGMSAWEARAVAKFVRAIRRGVLNAEDILSKGRRRTHHPKSSSSARKAMPPVFDLWGEEAAEWLGEADRHAPLPPIHAPRMPLPGHALSYTSNAGEGSVKALRLLQGNSEQMLQERFSRCLDLYMCPRGIRHKMVVEDATELLPTLPDPSALKPFPSTMSMDFAREDAIGTPVTSLSVDASSGQWLASAQGSRVFLWEIASGQCLHQWTFQEEDRQGALHVAFNPILPMLAVSQGRQVHLIVPAGLPKADLAESVLRKSSASLSKSVCSWSKASVNAGHLTRTIQGHSGDITTLAWHHRGDYLAVGCASQQHAVMIHQVSQAASQALSRKSRVKDGHPSIVSLAFHPTQPQLSVATRSGVRQYALKAPKITLLRRLRLRTPKPSICCVAQHPHGDWMVVGEAGGAMHCFDMTASVSEGNKIDPWRTMQLSSTFGINSTVFHPNFPLLAVAFRSTINNKLTVNAGDALVLHASHDDDRLDGEALIVPLKMLHSDDSTDPSPPPSFPVNSVCTWHPTQPWLFVGRADGRVALYV